MNPFKINTFKKNYLFLIEGSSLLYNIDLVSAIHQHELFIGIRMYGLPQWPSVKEFACKAREAGSIPGWRRSPGEGNGNPLQYSCLENPMDKGAWWATIHGVTKSQK